MEDAHWMRTLWIMFVAQLLSAVGFSVIFPFLPLYVQHLGSAWHWDIKLLAGLVFSSQAFTMMVASPIWGGLADRFGRKLMVERSLFGGALVLAAMAFVRSAEELVALRALQGLITGIISAANALVAATVPRQRIGYAMGVMQLGLTGGIAVGPLLGGSPCRLPGIPVRLSRHRGPVSCSGLAGYGGCSGGVPAPAKGVPGAMCPWGCGGRGEASCSAAAWPWPTDSVFSPISGA